MWIASSFHSLANDEHIPGAEALSVRKSLIQKGSATVEEYL